MPTTGVNAQASTIPPWAVQQRIGTTAGRYALNSMLMPRTDSGLSYIDYRSGVMASGDGNNTHLAMRVSPGTGMAVVVAQGNAVVNTSNQGAYMCCLGSTTTVTIPASSASQNRYDLVVARVYDDNNSALAGTSGLRQFTVELVQGDSASGTPTVPTAALPAGAIPLASVYVPAGASSIAGTQITDLRGPGLVARGGMRPLYGVDSQPGSPAFAQPGAYPGDQRFAFAAGFQHQVYYGSSQGWRGVHNCLVYTANPSAVGWVATNQVGGVNEICRVHVPYPGTPYMAYPTGRVMFQQGAGTAVDMRISIDAPNGNNPSGTMINWARHDVGNVNADTLQGLNVAPVMYGPFTDARDFVLSGCLVASDSGVTWGFNFPSSQTHDNLLSVNIYPSTVPPPA